MSGEKKWMHFHGQMSTHPAHRMHSDSLMWMNCLGLTAAFMYAVSTRVNW
jgi:hypothetical protein